MSSSTSDTAAGFTEGPKRPYYAPPTQKRGFRVGDRVYLLKSDGTREGPYLVASTPGTRTYTLCREDGETAYNGVIVGADALEAD
ncbi:hypothetical protein CC86DRAFT_328046 [Ophiobolus disseminans]|uniref:Hypervirulence associated protein TUDOR domain-containing protein n=1 Tax=Ophiobolus disseminans TaxID=1469910 RepID=A0A6A6ZT75_9PLEO|nr:hypothetical protein CC86DRAFT_328046 [Ophiobolus disseminans]